MLDGEGAATTAGAPGTAGEVTMTGVALGASGATDAEPQPLRGAIRVPSDKSLSHRIALFSALAQGTSHVQGLLDSLDVRSTLGVIEALGAKVELHASEVSEGGLSGTITGWGPAGPRAPKEALDCGNSGTTVRLLMGALAGFDISVVLEGDESLSARRTYGTDG